MIEYVSPIFILTTFKSLDLENTRTISSLSPIGKVSIIALVAL